MISHVLACHFRLDAQTIPFCWGKTHIILYRLYRLYMPSHCKELLLVSTGSGQRSATSLGRNSSWASQGPKNQSGTPPGAVRKKDHLRAQVESNSLWSIHFLLPNFQIVFRKHPVACSMFFNRLQWLILESRQTSQVLRFMSGVSLWLKTNCYTTFTFRFWVSNI